MPLYASKPMGVGSAPTDVPNYVDGVLTNPQTPTVPGLLDHQGTPWTGKDFAPDQWQKITQAANSGGSFGNNKSQIPDQIMRNPYNPYGYAYGGQQPAAAPVVASPKPMNFPAPAGVPPTNPYNDFNNTNVPTGNPDIGLNNGLIGTVNQGYSATPQWLMRAGAQPDGGKRNDTGPGLSSQQIAGNPGVPGNTKNAQLNRQDY